MFIKKLLKKKLKSSSGALLNKHMWLYVRRKDKHGVTQGMLGKNCTNDDYTGFRSQGRKMIKMKAWSTCCDNVPLILYFLPPGVAVLTSL